MRDDAVIVRSEPATIVSVRVAAAVLVALLACGRVHFDPLGDAQPADASFGEPPVPVSCMGLPPTCGPAGTNSCCETLPVPGGMFFRSYDVAGDGMHGTMDAPATVSSFWLDQYEVTVARYRRYVMAGQGTQANPPAPNAGARTLDGIPDQGGWDVSWNANLPADASAQLVALNCDAADQTWTDAPGPNESLPMNCLSWYDAMAFCIWDGGWLPTEAEWNYAASGGDEHRAYPWSSPPSSLTIDCSRANFFNSPTFCTGAANRVGSASPAGDGRWGHADLAGNLWEWTLDLDAPYVTPCIDCAQLTAGGVRVMRGGYFNNMLDNLRAANRSSDMPTNRVRYVGVRCARSASSP